MSSGSGRPVPDAGAAAQSHQARGICIALPGPLPAFTPSAVRRRIWPGPGKAGQLCLSSSSGAGCSARRFPPPQGTGARLLTLPIYSPHRRFSKNLLRLAGRKIPRPPSCGHARRSSLRPSLPAAAARRPREGPLFCTDFFSFFGIPPYIVCPSFRKM